MKNELLYIQFLKYNLVFAVILVIVSLVETGSLNPLQLQHSPPIPALVLVVEIFNLSFAVLFAYVLIIWISLSLSLFFRAKPFQKTWLYKRGWSEWSEAHFFLFSSVMGVITVLALVFTGSIDWTSLAVYRPSLLGNPHVTVGFLIVLVWLMLSAWLVSPSLYAVFRGQRPVTLKDGELDYSNYYNNFFTDWNSLERFAKKKSDRGNDLYMGSYYSPKSGLILSMSAELMKNESEALAVVQDYVNERVSEGFNKTSFPMPVKAQVVYKGRWVGVNRIQQVEYVYRYDNLMRAWVVETTVVPYQS